MEPLKFNIVTTIRAALEAGIGGFISAKLAGLDNNLCLLIAAFMALGGTYTDARGFFRQVATVKEIELLDTKKELKDTKSDLTDLSEEIVEPLKKVVVEQTKPVIPPKVVEAVKAVPPIDKSNES